MNIYQKLNDARAEFHTLQLKKTGKNAFAGYQYFELGDFLLPAMEVFGKHGLCAIVSFERELATMRIVSVDPKDSGEIVITSPMGSAALKGCHEVQNIGAVETYQRRYLWVAALEIVEHDALDATTGNGDKMDAAINAPSASPMVKGQEASPDWPIGPAKNITSLKAAARQLWRDIDNSPDADSLDALLVDESALLKQIKLASHEIWNGDGANNKGMGELIIRRQTELAMAAIDTAPLAGDNGNTVLNAG